MAVPVIPTFSDLSSSRQYQKQHMAAAFRYLSKQGYDEGIAGHISLRDPEYPDQFWINPLVKAFSTMKASDLVLVDEHGTILKGGNQVPINPAGFMIHSAIHKARPDVNAAVHTHSVYGKAFSALGIELDMISQDACRCSLLVQHFSCTRSLIRTTQATFSTKTTASTQISGVPYWMKKKLAISPTRWATTPRLFSKIMVC
jgi:ribulose-5-phosphate 4-epimerase/fuculose-1-phosphate aldolase